MVFTFLDKDKCMIYEPLLLKNNKFSTFSMTVEDGKINNIREEENILEALKKVKMPLNPILCGGKHTHNQEREQWHSGANFFAFAPGKVIGYERNVHTLDALNKSGFEIVSSEDVINNKVDVQKLPKITNLQQLRHINLDNNRLKNEDILIFRESIGDHVQLSYKNQKDILPFYIEKLSINTLNEAETLRNKIFLQIDKKEQKTLQASIDKEALSYVLKDNDIKDMQYWVAKDKENSQIIAMTGLYTELEDDEDSCWLGWFCLDKRYRGKGFGKELLNFSIEQAKSLSKRYLHLYTYDSKEYQVAINMYKSYGFKEYFIKDTRYKRDMYFKINIEEKND